MRRGSRPSLRRTDTQEGATLDAESSWESLLEGFDPKHYRSIGKIAAGAEGVVSKLELIPGSTRKPLPRLVALKSVPISCLSADYERQYHIMKGCTHENIVKLFYSEKMLFESMNDQMRFYMELCDSNLRDFLRAKTLDAEDVKYLGRQMVDGCRYLHSKKVIHRDIKPENILVIAKDASQIFGTIVKLADFGMAREMPSDDVSGSVEHSVVGTANYASPEVTRAMNRHEMVRTRAPYATDIFSLGVVVFEMITKRLPFTKPERALPAFDVEGKVVGNVKEPRLAECLLQMLQWDPERRPEASGIIEYFKPSKLTCSEDITCMCYISDEDVMIAGTSVGSLFTFNCAGNCKKAAAVTNHPHAISSVRYHKERVVASSPDGSVSFWRYSGPNQPLEFVDMLLEDGGWILCVDISDDYVVSGSDSVDKSLIVWKRYEDLQDKPMKYAEAPLEMSVSSILIDGDVVLCGLKNGKLVTYDATNRRVLKTTKIASSPICSFSKHGDSVYVATWREGVLRILSGEYKSVVQAVALRTDWLQQVMAGPDSLLCLTKHGQLKSFPMDAIARKLEIGDAPMEWEEGEEGKELRPRKDGSYEPCRNVLMLGQSNCYYYMCPKDKKVVEINHLGSTLLSKLL